MEMTIGSGTITAISAYYFTASALIGTSQQCLQVKLVDATGGFYFVSKSLTTSQIILVNATRGATSYMYSVVDSVSSNAKFMYPFLTKDLELIVYGYF